jgi:two-component system, cell cycle response regulator
MAASQIDSARPPRGAIEHLSEQALRVRLEEEVNRAGRHGTALSCLLLELEDVPELRRADGEELCERVLAYVQLTLRAELRRFDRVGRPAPSELLLVLPGADLRRGEIVARRVLTRLRAIKLQSGGERRALRVAAGLAPWRAGMSAGALLASARAAALPENGRRPG